MRPRIVVLGGGTGGTIVANRLGRIYGDDADVTVVDADDRHIYQPGLLFVPFGLARPRGMVRSRRAQLLDGIGFLEAKVDRVEYDASTVHFTNGDMLPYDVLVIATGAVLAPEETEGLTGPGWQRSVFTFYTLEGATRLRDALSRFDRGRLVVNLIDLPVKCPVAPLEFAFLTDWYLRERGVRERVELTFVTPLDGAFTKPVASRELGALLSEKGIALETEFATASVDGEGGGLVSWDGRRVAFDLLVAIPLHVGAPFVGRSPGLGDELNFVRTDPRTLQSKVAPNVFAIGDAADLPTSKAGSATHFEADTLVENIRRHIAWQLPKAGFDGHANCFIETGFHKALLIDFDYDRDPGPGRFPFEHMGPLPLLKESRLNHLAKLALQPVYWHALLRGYDEERMRSWQHLSK
jgi:sulfide:quinone oxidoreductase